MGRYVYCGGDCVWKYWFAIQGSNQHEITTRVGVGKIYGRTSIQEPLQVQHILDDREPDWNDEECDIVDADCGDTLWLTHDHVPKMRAWLEENKHMYDSSHLGSMSWDKVTENKGSMEVTAFWCMVQAYADYIDSCPNEEEFWFDGEY